MSEEKSRKTRPGWTEERRKKTMETRARNKAAKQKEVSDLKAQIDKLTLELVESRAIIEKQQEEIEALDLQLRGHPESVTAGRNWGSADSEIAAKIENQTKMLGKIFGEIATSFGWNNNPAPEVERSPRVAIVSSESLSTKDLRASAYVPQQIEEVDLSKLGIFELNKMAVDLGITRSSNKDMLIEKIGKALEKNWFEADRMLCRAESLAKKV